MSTIVFFIIIIQNLLTPLIFMVVWIKIDVNTQKKINELAERNFRTINSLQYKESFIRDYFADFSYNLQLGQSIQIFISVINATAYYIAIPKIISLVLLLQAISSSIIALMVLEIRHRKYPKEIKDI